MVDRLTSMSVFVKVVDAGSFTAAAKVLGMSGQMVGKHVVALETKLGLTLLQRTTRSQGLTETGQRFYERCRAILAETEAAYALAEDHETLPQGRLRVTAPVGFGATRLAPVLTEFLERNPAVEVELILTDRYVDLIEEGFDAALRLGPLETTNVVSHELAIHDQVACAAPAYLERHGEPRSPAELSDHQCMGYVNWSGQPYAEWRFGQEGTIHPIRIRPRFQVNDGRVLVAAAVAGHGVILQPRAVVADALALGTLTPILTAFTPPSRPMFVVCAPRQLQSAKLRAFLHHVSTVFPRLDATEPEADIV